MYMESSFYIIHYFPYLTTLLSFLLLFTKVKRILVIWLLFLSLLNLAYSNKSEIINYISKTSKQLNSKYILDSTQENQYKILIKNLKKDEIVDNENNVTFLSQDTRNKKIIVREKAYYIFGNLNNHIYIIKFSLNHEFLWAKEFKLNDIFRLNQVFDEKNGFLLQCTETYEDLDKRDNIVMVKIDNDGNIVWNTAIGTDEIYNILYQIHFGKNKYTLISTAHNDIYITQLNTKGKKVFEKRIINRKTPYFFEKVDDNFVLYTIDTLNGWQHEQYFLDEDFDILKNISIADFSEDIQRKRDHRLNALKSFTIKKDTVKKEFIIKKVKNNVTIWDYKIKKSSIDELYLIETSDKGCILQHIDYKEFENNNTTFVSKICSTSLIKLNATGSKEWEKKFTNGTGQYIIKVGSELTPNNYLFISEQYKRVHSTNKFITKEYQDMGSGEEQIKLLHFQN